MEAWRIVSGFQKRSSVKSPSADTVADSATAAQNELLEAKTLELQDAWDAKSDKTAGWIWLMLNSSDTRLMPPDVHNTFNVSEYCELWKPTGPSRID
jgi:hypothetical protein